MPPSEKHLLHYDTTQAMANKHERARISSFRSALLFKKVKQRPRKLVNASDRLTQCHRRVVAVRHILAVGTCFGKKSKPRRIAKKPMYRNDVELNRAFIFWLGEHEKARSFVFDFIRAIRGRVCSCRLAIRVVLGQQVGEWPFPFLTKRPTIPKER